MKIKKILVAVDGSDSAKRALEYTIDLSQQIGGEILLLHCHKPFPSILREPYFQEAINKINENAQQLIQPYCEMLDQAKLKYDKRILEGPPAQAISEAADIEHCDLIIMGSRGRSDLQGLILGSVTHRVLHCTTIPVMVIK